MCYFLLHESLLLHSPQLLKWRPCVEIFYPDNCFRLKSNLQQIWFENLLPFLINMSRHKLKCVETYDYLIWKFFCLLIILALGFPFNCEAFINALLNHCPFFNFSLDMNLLCDKIGDGPLSFSSLVCLKGIFDLGCCFIVSLLIKTLP